MKLRYSEILSSAWNSIRDELALVAGLTVVSFFGIWVFNLIPFLGYVVAAPLGLGYLKCLQQIRFKQVITYKDFFWAFLKLNRLLHVVLMNILVYLGTVIGFILFILPGIWFMVASVFSSAAFLLYAEDSVGSIQRSMTIVKHRWWNIFGFGFVLLLINMAGAICFAVGLLVSIPVSAVATLIAFEKLSASVHIPPAEPQSSSAKEPAEVTILP